MKTQTFVDHSHLLTGPLHVSFDVTNKCNARCLHCFNRSGNELIRDELTNEEFLNVIDQIAEVKPFSICYCGGEPMIRYNLLIEASKRLKAAGVKNIAMVSNGFFITEEKVIKLKEAGLGHIQISLDGAKAETHEKMRGVKGIYEKALSAMELIDKHGIHLAVAFSPTHFNIKEFPEVFELVKKFKNLINIRVQPLMPLGKATISDEELFPTEDDYRFYVKYINSLNPQVRTILEWGDPVDHLIRFNGNFGQVSFTEIKSDGSLSASSYLPIRIGNLKKHTLKEYWEAGLGKAWNIPIVSTFADSVLSIKDMDSENSNIPKIFFEDNINIDLIEDKPFENLENYTVEKLCKK